MNHNDWYHNNHHKIDNMRESASFFCDNFLVKKKLYNRSSKKNQKKNLTTESPFSMSRQIKIGTDISGNFKLMIKLQKTIK